MSLTDSKQGSNSYTVLVSLLILLILYLLYMSLGTCKNIFTNVFTGDNKEFIYLIFIHIRKGAPVSSDSFMRFPLRWLECRVYWWHHTSPRFNTGSKQRVVGAPECRMMLCLYNLDYRKTSSISRTESKNSNVSNIVLQLSLFNLLKPGVTSIMKM